MYFCEEDNELLLFENFVRKDYYSGTCLDQTLNKPKSCINKTLNEVIMQEIFVI